MYTITQPNGYVIVLNFIKMDLHDNSGSIKCNYYDYLEIRDGPSDDSPILAKLCSSKFWQDRMDAGASIQSSQNQLKMK